MVKISVIIPTYNNEKDIGECLKSLKNQTFKDFEIIVVDGYSKDKTVEIARKYADKVMFENIGTRGGACNIGAKYANGEILVFTDADAWFPKDWLKKIWKKFEENPDVSIIGGNDIVGKNATKLEKILFLFDLIKKIPKTQREIVDRLRGVNTAYKKDVFLSSGGFNEALHSIEETELHYRLYKLGYKFLFDPSIFVYHHRRRSLKSLAKQMIRNGIGRIEAISVNREILSKFDIIPLIGFLAFISGVPITILMGLSLPFILLIAFCLLYFLIKSFFVCLKTKKLKWVVKVFIVLVIREISFGIGLLLGILKKFLFLSKVCNNR